MFAGIWTCCYCEKYYLHAPPRLGTFLHFPLRPYLVIYAICFALSLLTLSLDPIPIVVRFSHCSLFFLPLTAYISGMYSSNSCILVLLLLLLLMVVETCVMSSFPFFAIDIGACELAIIQCACVYICALIAVCLTLLPLLYAASPKVYTAAAAAGYQIDRLFPKKDWRHP